MNYHVNGLTWRNIPKFPIELTNFEDYNACFPIIEEALKQSPRSFLAIRITIEADDPMDDRVLVIQYRYSGDKISVILIDEIAEYAINEDYRLYLNDQGYIKGTSIHGDDSDEDLEEIVKIILDYGVYVALGVQWSAFLMKERVEGTLDQYFDDLETQEIH